MADVNRLKKKAAEYEAKRQYERAIAAYEQIARSLGGKVREGDVPLFNRLGDLYLRIGDVESGTAMHEKAVDHYAELGFFNNAIALCNKILRQDPGRASIYYKLGKISARKGFISDAKQNFLEYSSRMQKAGKMDEAFRALKEFADLCPGQDDVRLSLAEQLLRANRPAEALEQLQVLHEQLRSEGRDAEAAAAVERMRGIDPNVMPREPSGPRKVADGDLIFLDLNDVERLDTEPVEGFEPTALAEGSGPGGFRALTPQEFGATQLPPPADPQREFARPRGYLTGLPLLDDFEPNTVPGVEPVPESPAAAPADVPAAEQPAAPDQGAYTAPDAASAAPDDGGGLAIEPFDSGFPEAGLTPDESQVQEFEDAEPHGPQDVVPDEEAAEEPAFEPAAEPWTAGAVSYEDETAIDDTAPGEVTVADESASAAAEEEQAAQQEQETEAPETEPYAAVPADDLQSGRDEPVAAAPGAETPAEEETPPRRTPRSDDEYIDLGEWLREVQTPRSTRMIADEGEIPPEGEQADFDEMLEKFKQGIAQNMEADDHASYYDLGVAFREMGLLDEAIAQFQKALRSRENRIATYEALGQCFVDKRQYEVAVTVLQRALREPGFEDERGLGVLYLLGLANERMRRPGEAARYYQRVFSVDIEFRDIVERRNAVTQAGR